MTLLDSELISDSSVPAAPRRRRWWSATLPVIAALVLTVIVGSVLLAHVIAPGGYNAQDITASYLAPTWFSGAHPLGTDDLGRDMLARLVYGGRPALGISSVAAVLATALGLALALVSVMGGRFWDGLFGRLADVQLAIPAVLL